MSIAKNSRPTGKTKAAVLCRFGLLLLALLAAPCAFAGEKNAEFVKASGISPEVFAFYGMKLSELAKKLPGVRFIDFTANGDSVCTAPRFGTSADADVTYLPPLTAGPEYSRWIGKESEMLKNNRLRVAAFDGKLGKLFPAIKDPVSFAQLEKFFGAPVEFSDLNKGFLPPHYYIFGKHFNLYFKDSDGKTLSPDARVVVEPKLESSK